jgi:predicted transglutaminase-like cysteine proteinase
MKKRLSITLACGVALGLLIISGLSCVSSATYPTGSVAEALPTIGSEFESYITPECQSVQETLHDILGDPPYELSQAGFDAIRDWVADDTDYMSDEERWGGDYWQTPEQTLLYRTGDCEDFSILLCSLLRAYGIDAESVYVALGTDDSSEEPEHAFLIEDWNQDGEWQRIEPQAPAQLASYTWLGSLKSHPDSGLDKYEITAAFNDIYYYDDASFSSSEDQANVWTLTKMITVAGDIVQRLSRLADYLLGLLFS